MTVYEGLEVWAEPNVGELAEGTVNISELCRNTYVAATLAGTVSCEATCVTDAQVDPMGSGSY